MIVQKDAIDWLKGLEKNSIDLIVTDPAYESMEKYRSTGTTTRLKKSKGSSNSWFPVFPDSRLPAMIQEMHRVLKKDAHAYVFCNDDTSDYIKELALVYGFRRVKRLIWDKQKMGMGYRYRAKYELILFMEKGKRRLNSNSIPDVLPCPRLKGSQYYPTEKPVPLLEVLIEQSSNKGELVIDPFCGSGSTGDAATNLGRRFLGADVSEGAVAVSTLRLSGRSA